MAATYTSSEQLKNLLSSSDNVLLLDCRSNDEYKKRHIVTSNNIVLPQLMMRRLKAGKLSLKSLLPHSSRHTKDAFLQKCSHFNVVIYDRNTSVFENADSSSMIALLFKRIKKEGCKVSILRGGYDNFKTKFPECCASMNENGNHSGSETASDEEFHSDDSSFQSPGRCSPVSPLRGATPVLGLGALKIASIRTREEDYVFESDPSNAEMLTNRLRIDCGYSKPPRFQRSKSSYNSLPAPAEILPGLYLGCAKDAASEEVLFKYGITHILNVTPNLPNVFESDSRYCYKQIPIIDHWSQNLSQFFPEAIQFIDEARSQGNGVLVHCLAGISRSVTLTVAYLMHTHKWSLNYAYDFVKLRKADVSPNFNFMGQLLDFEKQLGLTSQPVVMISSETGSPASYASSSTGSTGSGIGCQTLFFTSPSTPATGSKRSSFAMPTPLA